MHTERVFLIATIRVCATCSHAENPYLPGTCPHDGCTCRGACSYEGAADAGAHVRLVATLKRQGPSRVDVVRGGLLITPWHAKKPRRPAPGPKVEKVKIVKRKPRQLNFFDGFLDRLEEKVGKGGS